MITRSLILIAALMCHAAIYGQLPSYEVTHYTNQEGLPSNAVKGIAYDSASQLLWIATEAGMVSFDGSSHFRMFKDPLFPSARIRGISKYNNDSIRFINDQYRVFKIAGQQPVFDRFSKINLFASQIFDAQKDIPQRMAAMIDKLGNEMLPRLGSTPLFLPNFNNQRFLFTVGNLLYFHNKQTNKTISVQGSSFQNLLSIVQPFLLDTLTCYYDVAKGFFKINATGTQVVPLVIEGLPNAIGINLISNNALPEVADKTNLYQLRLVDGKARAVLVCDMLPWPADITYVCHIPSIHSLFLGDQRNGLYVYKEKILQQSKNRDHPEAQFSEYGQAEGPVGIVTTARGHYQLGKYPQPIPTWLPDLAETNGFYNFMIHPHDSSWWYNNASSVIQIKSPSHTRTVYATSLTYGSWVFVADGKKVYGASENEIMLFDKGKATQLHRFAKEPQQIQHELYDMNDIVLMDSNTLCVAYGTGAGFFDISLKQWQPILFPIKTSVRCLWRYNNYLFLGTFGNGFFIYHDGILKRIPLDKNNYLNYTHCFMPDDAGYLWMSTNMGLFKASVKTLLAAFSSPEQPVYYHYFGKQDGLSNTEFNGGCQPCALRLHDGRFSFPSMDGLVLFRPDIPVLVPSGKVLFEGCRLGDSTYAPGSEALQNIPHDRSAIDFRFAIPNWGNKENLNSWYRLWPLQKEWIPFDATLQDRLLFNSIPSGDYKLEIKVLNGFGLNDFRISIMSVKIMPPWYRTWWAVTLWILLATLAIYQLLRWRIRTVNKRLMLEKLMTEQELKTLRAQINPHMLHNMFEMLGQNIVMDKDLRGLSVLQQVSIYMRNILRQTEHADVTLENELRYTTDYLHLQQTVHKDLLRYTFSVDEKTDLFQVMLPSLMLQPLVENALKYGQPSPTTGLLEIGISVMHEKHYTHITISNTGPLKIETTQSNEPHGLSITRNRLMLYYKKYKHPSSITIHDADNITFVNIMIPLS